jgi:hypothetical protein
MTSILRSKKIMVIAWLGVALLALLTAYGWFSKETVIYEDNDIDGYGFRALVTCRPDEGFTYYPYLVIKTPRGMEVSRSQLNGLGYEASKACRNSFPVARLEMVTDKRVIRVHFNGRNAFGDLDTLDVPIQYFSPR